MKNLEGKKFYHIHNSYIFNICVFDILETNSSMIQRTDVSKDKKGWRILVNVNLAFFPAYRNAILDLPSVVTQCVYIRPLRLRGKGCFVFFFSKKRSLDLVLFNNLIEGKGFIQCLSRKIYLYTSMVTIYIHNYGYIYTFTHSEIKLSEVYGFGAEFFPSIFFFSMSGKFVHRLPYWL